MASFAENFQVLCDRVVSIMGIIKSDASFKTNKRVYSTTKGGEAKVYDFSDDIQEIRAIAERIELRLFKYTEAMQETLNDMTLITDKLVSLRLEAPQTMIIPKEEKTEHAEAGPRTIKAPPFKKPGDAQAELEYKQRGRPKARLVIPRVSETE